VLRRQLAGRANKVPSLATLDHQIMEARRLLDFPLLASRQAAPLRADPDFERDFERLSAAIFPDGSPDVRAACARPGSEAGRPTNGPSIEPVRLMKISNGLLLTTSIQFSRDGRHLAIGMVRRVRMWDYPEGTLAWEVKTGGLKLGDNEVAFDPDGRMVASASDDLYARVWAVQTGDLLWSRRFEESPSRVAFSSDGRQIAVAHGASTVPIYPVPGEGVVDELSHGQPVHDVAFSADGTWIATTSTRSCVLWDARSHSRQTSIFADEHVSRAFFLPNSSALVVTDAEAVIIWALDEERERHRLTTGKRPKAVACSGDSSLVASAYEDGSVCIWDVESGARLRTLKHLAESVCLAFDPLKPVLAEVTFGRSVALRDLSQVRR